MVPSQNWKLINADGFLAAHYENSATRWSVAPIARAMKLDVGLKGRRYQEIVGIRLLGGELIVRADA